MNKVIHIEVSKSLWKEGTFSIRVGDILGSTEHSNCSREDLDWEFKDAIQKLIDSQEETPQLSPLKTSELATQKPDTSSTKRVIDWNELIRKTSIRQCLLCETNLDKDIGKGKWHIPLCKVHRMEELDKLNTSQSLSAPKENKQ